MFDEENVNIPYQLSGDCLSALADDAAAAAAAGGDSSSENRNKEETQKQLLQYNPTLDFSELLGDDESGLVTASGREFLSEY